MEKVESGLLKSIKKIKIPDIISSKSFIVIDDPNVVRIPEELGRNLPSPFKKKGVSKS